MEEKLSSFPSYLTNRCFSDMVSLYPAEIKRKRDIVGLLDFLSSYWLWTIIALFVAKWVFSLVSRKSLFLTVSVLLMQKTPI